MYAFVFEGSSLSIWIADFFVNKMQKR